jgi:uncharacterized protein YkwD
VGLRRQATQYVNKLRADRGLDKLIWDPRLKRPTRRHSREMARSGELVHTEEADFQKRMDRNIGVGQWARAGENIGASGDLNGNGWDQQDFDNLMTAFRQSKRHRRNMLRPGYDRIGVGLARNADGRLYLTYWFYG